MGKHQVHAGQRTFLLKPVSAACRCTLAHRPRGPVFLYRQLGVIRA